jgi:thermitase
VHAIDVTNDPLQGDQQSLSRILVRDAWDRTHGDARRIAIVDSGMYQNHPDLLAKIDGAVNTQWGNYSHDDRLGHGTHVAGVAAATTNNGEGVAGIGFDAHLLNVKAIDDYGSGSAGSVADGIIWATDRNARVINLSLAGSRDCEPWWLEDWTDTGVAYLRDAIDYAFSRGVVIVAGAGNTGATGKLYPAACPHVLSVANTTIADAKASDSTYGTWVNVAAPGSSILSTALPGGTHCQQDAKGWYARCSGTSIAAPHVSGLAALVQTSCAPMDAQAVIDRIMSTSDQIPGTGTFWQAGRINAKQAVCLPNPTGLSITTVTDTSMSFIWNDRSTTESSFEFASRPAGGAWQTVTLPANSTSSMTYTVTGLTPLATYEFHVRACDAQGCSFWSNTVTGRPNAFQLHVFFTGTGRVSSNPSGIDCGFMRLDCTEYYTVNTVVGLVPFPMVNPTTHDEFEFDHWEGACAGQGYSCTVTVNQALTARAVFVKIGNSGP